MSKSSIYESNWINLVFENRNKEYGAFQLRQENTKTSLMALLVCVSICAIVFTIPKVLSSFSPTVSAPIEIPPKLAEPLVVTTVDIEPRVKQEVKKTLPPVNHVKTPDLTLKSLAHPIVVETQQATDEVPKNSDPIVSKPTLSEGNGGLGIKLTESGTGTNTNSTTDTGNIVVAANRLDKLPTFPGGMEKFYQFIGQNFESPQIDVEKSIRIYVSFIVEKDGTMTDIKVKNDPGYGLANEAIRVMKSFKTKWTPGIIDSKPVRTSYNLPIVVQMN